MSAPTFSTTKNHSPELLSQVGAVLRKTVMAILARVIIPSLHRPKCPANRLARDLCRSTMSCSAGPGMFCFGDVFRFQPKREREAFQ
jgi:hypothetical protein